MPRGTMSRPTPMSLVGSFSLHFREFHHQVRGRRHATEGSHCQDSTAYLSQNGIQALCLSDGAGSADRSELGAQTAVVAGCRLLVERFDDFIENSDGSEVALELLAHLRTKLELTASKHNCDLDALASTFLAVAVSADSYLLFHVGDGVIGIQRDESTEVASAPNNAEFSNQTTFLTSSNALSGARLARGSLADISGFVLMSDGTSASLYDWRSGELANACGKLIAHVAAAPARRVKSPAGARQIQRFMDTAVRNATRDDCSIGILGRTLS